MRVLALDTTTRSGSAALVDGDHVVEERAGDLSRTHAERLPGELVSLLAHHGLGTADIDLFAVASGPGSFTGLRIGIATIQGLAFVHQRPVVAVSALDALAQIASVRTRVARPIIAAWIDAHRGEVFSALYEVTGAQPYAEGRLVPVETAAVASPKQTLNGWAGRLAVGRVVFIGDGAALYRETVVGGAAEILPPPLIAGAIGRMALDRAAAGAATGPAGIQPLYVRRPDAEIAREAERRRADERASADHVDGLAG